MRILIASIIGLLVAVVATLWVKEDNGYILIGYGHWTIEGSLALFLLTGAMLFILSYVLLRSLARLWAMPDQLQGWNGRRLATRARHSLTQGLLELAEGNWKTAEQHLTQHASQSETPLLNYLAAARAAQLQGEDERRDDYLQLAHESMPAADVAVGLTQAELQLAHQQYEQALATLTHLRGLSPKHSYVLTLLKRLYVNLGEWERLEELLPELRRRKAVSEAEYQALEIQVYRERMASMNSDPEALEQLWQRMPKTLRQHPPLMKSYVSLQIALNEGLRVAPLITEALKRQWDPELVRLYGRIDSGDVSHHLTSAEAWLKERPQDADLLLTLALLCLRNKLWGKARSYLEASIGISPKVEAYQELGMLLEQMGELEKALECFRIGLGLERREMARRLSSVPNNRPVLNYQASKPTVLEGA